MSRTLDHLFDRNVAWAHAKTRDDPRFFVRMAEQQTPRYLWVGCSDSRVTANDVLGLDPGEVFVHRNVGNIVHTSDMNLLSVLEFAVDQLGVEHVIVCGHYGCGGMRRALSGGRGELVDHWLQPISMFYRKHRAVFDALDEEARLARLCEINVEMQVRRLAATPIVENAWARNQPVHLHGWLYAIHDGLLRDLGPHLSSVAEREALVSLDHRVSNPVEPVTALRRHAQEAFASEAASGACCAPARSLRP
ncbi:carbonic anhydrase [Alsobacter sp. SYSU M60028]|uniref:Carbonic anhydrase n=1 Tax=Alsobacter ponti TaxID=2962936 RepID=A0ABT1LEP0_9HYPH|nr:carbonic anhydrase [Alsobacter ponti]MCP8939568.1 carbonic anhydrase [Alsobacter ponti]